MKAIVLLVVVFGVLVVLGAPGLGQVRDMVSGTPPTTAVSPTPPGPSPTAGAPGAGQPNETVMSEADVNKKVSEALQSNTQVPMRDVQVKLRGNNLIDVTGRTTFAGGDTPMEATLALRSGNGTLDVDVQKAQAGAFPLPSNIVQPLVQQALRAAGLQSLQGNQLPDGYDRVEVRPGQLVMIRK